MCSPTTTIGTPNDQPEGWWLTLHEPSPEDLDQQGPEANPKEQAQQTNFVVKDILHHHYKDDPFLGNLLNQASVNPFSAAYRMFYNGTSYKFFFHAIALVNKYSSDTPISGLFHNGTFQVSENPKIKRPLERNIS